MECDIPPPQELRKPLVVTYNYMICPGPTNVSPRVLHAMGQPIIAPLHRQAGEIQAEIKAGLKYLFQTKNEWTFAFCGTGSLGTEAVLVSLYEPGDTVLIAVNGIWSMRAAEMAERHGATVHRLETTHGRTFTIHQIEEALKKYRPQIFFIVQGESTTGVCQKIEGIGPLCHRYNCLLIVDAVVSLGGVPLFTDKWDIDVVVSASQKAIAAVCGLAPVTFGPRAVNKIMNRKSKIKSFFMDAELEARFWQCFGPDKPRQYHYTPAMNLMYALREALAEIVEEGLENRWRRHQKNAEHLRKGVRALGFELFPPEGEPLLDVVTTIHATPNIDWKKVWSYAMEIHQSELQLGYGPTSGRLHRIGHMAHNSCPEMVEHTLKVLKDATEYCRIKN